MSRTEHVVGTLTPLEVVGDREHAAKVALLMMGAEFDPDFESCVEQLKDEGYRQWLVTDDAVYKIEHQELDPGDDIYRATKKADGSINFEVRFYNGGQPLDEAIETALKGL